MYSLSLCIMCLAYGKVCLLLYCKHNLRNYLSLRILCILYGTVCLLGVLCIVYGTDFLLKFCTFRVECWYTEHNLSLRRLIVFFFWIACNAGIVAPFLQCLQLRAFCHPYTCISRLDIDFGVPTPL